MQTAQQLHTKLVLYPPRAVPVEFWLALGACPQEHFSLESGVHFKGDLPLTPTFPNLVCIPVLSQHITLIWRTTFRSRNCMGQTGTQCTGQARPHRQQGARTCSMEVMASLPPTDWSWLFSKPGFAWCQCGCFWAPASLDLHFTLSPGYL